MSLEGRWKALLLALAVGLVFGLLDVGEPMERVGQVVRDKLRNHAGSGSVVLVAIDDRSLRDVGALPWNGEQLAELVRRVDAAGARRIHLDANLDQIGSRRQAVALESALASARADILLPARFSIDPISGTRADYLPPDRLARHARIVNSNLRVSWDGAIWSHPHGARAGDRLIPSLAAELAGSAEPSESLFRIDYGIDLRSIPVVSAYDLLRDAVPDHRLQGRQVVIARTDLAADHYRAPSFGLVPAAFFHLIAAETLTAGRPLDLGWAPLLLLCALAAAAVVGLRPRVAASAILGATVAVLVAAPLLLEQNFIHTDVVPALALLATASLYRLITGLRRAYRARGTTDLLTGLPNLQALRQAESRGGGIVVAARIMNYARIATTLQVPLEKELVEQIVGRLEFGSGGATTYQAGPGVFAWIAENMEEDDLVQQLEGLQALFRSPIVIGPRLIDIAVTFGIDTEDDRPLTQRAASALVAADEAAREGKRWASFNPASAADADWRLSLLARLDHAIEHRELWVAYQPKVDCQSGRIVGAEALVRWTHPEKGQLQPDQFIAAAEQGGRIDALTAFVLDTALADMASFNRRGRRFSVAVNLSAQLLDSLTLVPTVEAALRKHGFSPELLTLEVTETSTLGSGARQIANLQRLSRLGVELSIDDYGTGFSTLEYLKRIPASELKIDRSFIGMLDKSKGDRIMVNSTIQLAHSLGRRVVAEGVENAEVLAELKRMRCDVVQGYHLGRPMPVADLRKLLKASGASRQAA
ncbi:putative bifunctional diguanylate cyclase/phosphodiesterase [Sphingosinicella terrae]|uniref:putative bifunctional diguanylate cyclase/phosphodiesterase n=1 Tax=Sphingosinicella terrae TaxID=2172047 RepID=UPI000E0DDEFA|nr:EAL domain-containing protein [Sphingosinicella terrae]